MKEKVNNRPIGITVLAALYILGAGMGLLTLASNLVSGSVNTESGTFAAILVFGTSTMISFVTLFAGIDLLSGNIRGYILANFYLVYNIFNDIATVIAIQYLNNQLVISQYALRILLSIVIIVFLNYKTSLAYFKIKIEQIRSYMLMVAIVALVLVVLVNGLYLLFAS